MHTFWHKLQLRTLRWIICSYVFVHFTCSRKPGFASLCNCSHLWSMLLQDVVLSTCLKNIQMLGGKFHSRQWQNCRSVFLPFFSFPSFSANNLKVHVGSVGTVIHCSCIALYFLRGVVNFWSFKSSSKWRLGLRKHCKWWKTQQQWMHRKRVCIYPVVLLMKDKSFQSAFRKVLHCHLVV